MRLLIAISIFLLLGSSAYADQVVADLEAAGETKESSMLFEREGSVFTADKELTFGTCQSRVLNDFGVVKMEERTQGDILHLTLKDACLDRKDMDLRAMKPLKLEDSKSFFLNYSVAISETGSEAKGNYTFGTGIYLDKALLYSDFAQQPNGGLVHGNSYITRDFIPYKLNATAGDAYLVTNSVFAKQEQVLGLVLRRNYSVDPSFNPYNSVSQTLTLTTHSQLEIYRDGQLIDKLDLAAGVYDIRNLPISAFAGSLKIKIRDAYNVEKTIDIPYVVSQSNLKKGVDDFNFAAGLKRQGDTYSSPTEGGYYRRGITDDLTLGVATSTQVTLNATYSTTFGAFTVEEPIHLDHLADNYHLSWNYSNVKYSAAADFLELKGEANLTAQFSLPLTTAGIPDPKWGTASIMFYGYALDTSR